MIHNISDLRVGDKVHYKPDHYADNEWENGMIKEIRPDRYDVVWVVYNCNGCWNQFKEYTSACTNLRDLHPDWRFE